MARGIVGKFLKGAAAGAQQALPMMLEKSRNAAIAARDATMREYAKEDQATQNTFTAGQNQLQMDQRKTEFTAEQTDGDRARTDLATYQDKQFGLQERGVGMEEEKLKMDTASWSKLMEKAQIDVDSGKLSLKALQQIDDLNTQLLAAKTPEERAAIFTNLLNLQGKSEKGFEKMSGGIDPVTGEVIQYILSTNIAAGTWENLGSGSSGLMGGAGGGADPYEKGKVYPDADGNTATYLGNGEWDEGPAPPAKPGTETDLLFESIRKMTPPVKPKAWPMSPSLSRSLNTNMPLSSGIISSRRTGQ